MAKQAKAEDAVLRVEGSTRPKKQSALAGQQATGKVDVDAYAADATGKPVEGDSLKVLQSLAQELINEGRAVALAELELKKAQGRLIDVAEHRLPDLMEAHSLPKFEFFDRQTGTTLVIKLESDKWRVSMPPMKDDQGNPIPGAMEDRKVVFGWLREEGQGGSIKKNLEAPLGLLPDAEADAIVQTFKATYPNLDPVLTEKVEPSTLTALVSRMLKAGKAVHANIQVKPVRQAKVLTK